MDRPLPSSTRVLSGRATECSLLPAPPATVWTFYNSFRCRPSHDTGTSLPSPRSALPNLTRPFIIPPSPAMTNVSTNPTDHDLHQIMQMLYPVYVFRCEMLCKKPSYTDTIPQKTCAQAVPYTFHPTNTIYSRWCSITYSFSERSRP